MPEAQALASTRQLLSCAGKAEKRTCAADIQQGERLKAGVLAPLQGQRACACRRRSACAPTIP